MHHHRPILKRWIQPVPVHGGKGHGRTTGPGNANASLVTNDTYAGTDHQTHESAEQVILKQTLRMDDLCAEIRGLLAAPHARRLHHQTEEGKDA